MENPIHEIRAMLSRTSWPPLDAPGMSEENLEFIFDWSRWFYDNTDTFNGAIGRSLAYLWPAIVNDSCISVSPQYAIVRLLKRHGVPASNAIWEYLNVE